MRVLPWAHDREGGCSMAGNALAPVYLIHGDDALKRDAMVRRLQGRFAQLGDPDFNTETFVAAKGLADDIIASCNILPFASSLRLVIVKETEKLARADISKLVDYVKAPCDTTVLVLCAGALAKTKAQVSRTALYKAVKDSWPKSIIDCYGKRERELASLVSNMARSHGAHIDPDAAALLIERVGTDTVALDREVAKLAMAADDGKVTFDLVQDFSAQTSTAKPWELADAMCARDASRVLSVLARTTDTTALSKLFNCCNRIRDLITCKSLEERGRLSEVGAHLGRMAWKQGDYVRWSRTFGAGELRDALTGAAEAERLMKSGSDADLTLELWLLSVCSGHPFLPPA